MKYVENETFVKIDNQGREYTTELGFADFVYSFIKSVKVATTGDIISHVRDNFDFLEGDIVKTSEKRSNFRYRQMVDNLIKSHGSILNVYDELTDFHGGICIRGSVISDEIIERVKAETSTAAKRAEAARLKKEEMMREEQLRSIARQKNINIAISKGRSLRKAILTAVEKANGDIEEVIEYYDDIIQDVAHRHPEALSANDEDFIIAFVKEC